MPDQIAANSKIKVTHDYFVENLIVKENGVDCLETLNLVQDVRNIWCGLFQRMPVMGPWLEQRISWLIKSWLPGWQVGSGQIFDHSNLNIRSRSWDIIVYKKPEKCIHLPPEAYPGSGHPLVPRNLCCAVIDTKNYFSDLEEYANKTVVNLMNDAKDKQLEFLGDSISKCIFVCMCPLSPKNLEAKGSKLGLNVYVLGKHTASKVSDGENRRLEWLLNNSYKSPLIRFRNELMKSAKTWEKNNP